jgi:hypothetical protein
MANSKISTLVENFNTGIIDTTVWDVNDPSEGLGGDAVVDIVNGQLNITVATAGVYGGIQSFGWFDMTGSEVIIQLVDAGDQATTSVNDVWPIWVVDTNGLGFGWEVQSGLVWSGFPAGVVGPAFPYDPAVHKWFRIRELDGTFYEDYSPDRVNWTTMFSSPNTFGFVPTAVQLSLQAGNPGGTDQAPSTAIFDNVNYEVFKWVTVDRSTGYDYNDILVAVSTKVKGPADISFNDAHP